MTDDRTALAKYLRSSAQYHRPLKTPVVVRWDAMRAMKDAGVVLELPIRGFPGKLTPDEAERYAEQLEGTRT